jgi:hypothetical protein
MIAAVTRKGLIFAAASGLIGVTMLAGAFAQTKKLGDGLSSEGAGALFERQLWIAPEAALTFLAAITRSF